MREKRKRQELQALGYQPFEPTDAQRDMVRTLRFNGLGEERIAAIIGISVDELVYNFAVELEYSSDMIQAIAAQNVMRIAAMTDTETTAALKANALILQSRNKLWRVPKEEPTEQRKAIEKMSLSELEAELEALDARRRAAAADHPAED